MKKHNRFRPSLEILEERWCPTLKTVFSQGTLSLSGTPTGSGTGQALLVIRNGTNYQVLDGANVTTLTGGTNIGTFALTKDLHLNLMSYRENIFVDLNGGTFPGSIYLSLGQGVTGGSLLSVSVFGNGTAADHVNGSVYVQQGSGQEVFNVGQATPTSLMPATTAVTVGGNVTFSGASQTGFLGNAINIAPGSVVSGNLNASAAAQVTIGEFSFVGGSVSGNVMVSNANQPILSNLVIIGQVGGNVNFMGSNNGDTVSLFNTPAGPPHGSVGGSMTLIMGTGAGPILPSLVNMDTGTFVGGSLTILAGNGGTQVSLSGTIGGNLSVTAGNGANAVDLGNNGGAFFNLPGPLTVGGTVNLNLGAGGNAVEFFTGTTVGKSVTMTMGNGTNTFTLDAGAQVLGRTLSFTGGTVHDTVMINNAIANVFALNVLFKNGIRELDIAAGTSLDSAYINFGTGSGTKTLNSPTVTWDETIVNFP